MIKTGKVTNTKKPKSTFKVEMRHVDPLIAASMSRNGAPPKLEYCQAYSPLQAMLIVNLRDGNWHAINAELEVGKEEN